MILLLLFITILAIVTTPSLIWLYFVVGPILYFGAIYLQELWAKREIEREEEKRQAKKKSKRRNKR